MSQGQPGLLPAPGRAVAVADGSGPQRAASRPGTADWLVAAGGGLACLIDAFSPWLRSGSVERDGYQLLATSTRAGLVTGTWAHLLVVAAYLLPTVAAATLAALVASRARAGLVLAGLTGAVLGAGSLIVLRKVHGGLLFGPYLGLALAATTVLAAAARTMTRGSHR